MTNGMYFTTALIATRITAKIIKYLQHNEVKSVTQGNYRTLVNFYFYLQHLIGL